jgi:N-acetylglutamate synthase-like GNAT family acetyltransferase
MTTGYGQSRYQARRQLKPRPAPAPLPAPVPAPAPRPAPARTDTRARRESVPPDTAATTLDSGVPLMTRVATGSDRAALEALQRRGAPAAPAERQTLRADPDDPAPAQNQIDACQVIVAERGEDVVGFAAFRPRDDGDCELHALVVEPDRWRLAAVHLLVEHCAEAARLQGARALHATGDPGAQPFHPGCGFEFVGTATTPLGPAQLLRRPLVRT